LPLRVISRMPTGSRRAMEPEGGRAAGDGMQGSKKRAEPRAHRDVKKICSPFARS
jgi:hypothetical protein